jgi:hypothetical protein
MGGMPMLLMKRITSLILGLCLMFILGAVRPTSRTVDPLLNPARDAVVNRSLPAFGGEVERQLRAQFEKGKDLDAAEVLRLATWREFSRYFARVNGTTVGQQETLAWLAAQRELLPALMMGVSEADPPNRVLEVLRSLRADHRKKVEEFPELAAAVCVVWDAHERFGGNAMGDDEVRLDPGEPSRVFEHFARDADRMAADVRKLPMDLLVYVVDTHLGPMEIEWASRYGGGARANVAGAFFAVPFREGVYYERNAPTPVVANAPNAGPGEGGVEIELNKKSYVLPNILRRGGSVHDAAYFATEIARANGIPAVVCISNLDSPIAAWCGFLQVGGGGSKATWDATSARHVQHVPWVGFAQDPQTYEFRSEAELTVLSGVLAAGTRQRQTSTALLKSADLMPNVAARSEMIRRAIGVMPANRRAWYALADVASKEKFDEVAMKEVEALMHEHLDRRWPEFATMLRLRAVAGRGTIEFDDGIDRAEEAVRDRPELVTLARLAQVERYVEDKKKKEAIELLIKLLQRKPALSSPSALAVMLHLDDLLHRENDLPRLNEIYRAVFNAIPRPTPSLHMRTTPYWRMGWKYADLLAEMKDEQGANVLRGKLNALVVPAPAAVE